MPINKNLFILLCCFVIMVSCSKKTNPSSVGNTTAPAAKTKKITTPVPKIITVNDEVAKKSADGRLYYDLEGKRYWKNYKNGKYYLFNKTMYSNPEFNPL